MTIEQTNVVDFIGTDITTGSVHLTIADHLEWNADHILKLEEKLNSYLAYVESGELYLSYPQAGVTGIVFDLVLKHRPTDEALSFLEKAGSVIELAGFTFRYGPLGSAYTNDNG
jgi:hypothetical protein